MTTPDAIQDQVLLPCPPARAWALLADHRQFGAWFKVDLQAPFQPGAVARGPITHAGMEHVQWEATVVALEPMTRLAFSWHPGGIDPDVDYAAEPTTLVALTLAPAPGGTLLQVDETGFSRLPEARRAKAYDMNKGGWAWQMGSVARYLAEHP